MNAVRDCYRRIVATGKRRRESVKTEAMGRVRTFDAYDIGVDTFIFERGIVSHLSERPSILIVEKRHLRGGARGWVLTMTTGNHSVAAFPLLDGRFWGLSTLPRDKRSATLLTRILCANAVDGRLELSQREIATEALVAVDRWLREKLAFEYAEVVFIERQLETLEYFRKLGMEWRVKPLAWTESEMRLALSASRRPIAAKLGYYHSVRGVHFLSFAEFSRFMASFEHEPKEFIKGLRELVGVYEGNDCSFMRLPKCHAHHEIEPFGLTHDLAQLRLVPALEQLLARVSEPKMDHAEVKRKIAEIVRTFRELLVKPEFADENSSAFVESLYMNLTGEIYQAQGEGFAVAFDDRRTALPGATFVGGRAVMHPGADARTDGLMKNLCAMLSQDEIIEYANVYELRTADSSVALGSGSTREIVYKTNRRPLESSLIEKELAQVTEGYTAYMLARVGALRALGVELSTYYRVLKRRSGKKYARRDHYIRTRCEGEPMEAIPSSYFRHGDGSGAEDREVVLALASLMGDVAAQTMAMKKYDPKSESPLYGVGKEIYGFDYDIARERMMPKRVAICSIRGSFGWPCLDFTEANLKALANFYFGHFAHAVKLYVAAHPCVTMAEAAARFMDGFEFRTHAMRWHFGTKREEFENFAPKVLKRFKFDERWRFVMWSLDAQERHGKRLRDLFFRKVRIEERS